MKKTILIVSATIISFATIAFGQDILQSHVPSVIVNNFHQIYPKAHDVEWELDAERYKVEFKTGYGTDHEIWFDKTGKQIRHKEEISKSSLPKKVLDKISINFGNYRVDDVEKITESDQTIYKLELKSFTEEWKVVFDNEGNVLSKVAD